MNDDADSRLGNRQLADPNRYSRQTRFSPIGERGQSRIAAAKVLLVGCGALGSSIANTLVRAGVGRLRIVDRDFVDLSNLQRQSLFTEQDVVDDLPKAIAAARYLRNVNSSVQIEALVSDASPSTIRSLMHQCRPDPRRHRQL